MLLCMAVNFPRSPSNMVSARLNGKADLKRSKSLPKVSEISVSDYHNETDTDTVGLRGEQLGKLISGRNNGVTPVSGKYTRLINGKLNSAICGKRNRQLNGVVTGALGDRVSLPVNGLPQDVATCTREELLLRLLSGESNGLKQMKGKVSGGNTTTQEIRGKPRGSNLEFPLSQRILEKPRIDIDGPSISRSSSDTFSSSHCEKSTLKPALNGKWITEISSSRSPQSRLSRSPQCKVQRSPRCRLIAKSGSPRSLHGRDSVEFGKISTPKPLNGSENVEFGKISTPKPLNGSESVEVGESSTPKPLNGKLNGDIHEKCISRLKSDREKRTRSFNGRLDVDSGGKLSLKPSQGTGTGTCINNIAVLQREISCPRSSDDKQNSTEESPLVNRKENRPDKERFIVRKLPIRRLNGAVRVGGKHILARTNEGSHVKGRDDLCMQRPVNGVPASTCSSDCPNGDRKLDGRHLHSPSRPLNSGFINGRLIRPIYTDKFNESQGKTFTSLHVHANGLSTRTLIESVSEGLIKERVKVPNNKNTGSSNSPVNSIGSSGTGSVGCSAASTKLLVRQCRIGEALAFGVIQLDSQQPNGNGYSDSHGLVTIRMKPDNQGRFGFNVKGGADQGMPIIVSRVAPNTPADVCIPRLNEGDQVLFINGRDVSQHTHEQVVMFIRASRETHSGELVLVVRPNVYLGEDTIEEPDFMYIPETQQITSSAGGNALEASLLLLQEGIESGPALAQFEQLYRKKMGMTMNAARMGENIPKNRYRDISPYDQTRVVLKSGPTGDYINANFVNMEIPGSGIVNRYIAAQGPLPNTCMDFWQMVWEQQSSLVVMLTAKVERGRPKCHQYWPDLYETADFGTLQITCVKEEETASFAFREFNLTHVETNEERHIVHMQYIAWPDHGVPDDSSDFLDFVLKVRQNRVGMVEPTIVHCSAGIGRTGVLITMETAMCLIEANQPVYPLSIVRQMRDQRAMLIQTSSQYKFVCEAILRVYHEGLVKPLDDYKR